MGAVAVHHLAARIHELTAQASGAKKKADPSFDELRGKLIAAYAELATVSQQLADKKSAVAAAR